MRKNKSQRDQRRSHLHADIARLTTDTETGSTHLRHRLDLKTGMYRGRQVLDLESKAAKDTARSNRRSKLMADENQDEVTTALPAQNDKVVAKDEKSNAAKNKVAKKSSRVATSTD